MGGRRSSGKKGRIGRNGQERRKEEGEKKHHRGGNTKQQPPPPTPPHLAPNPSGSGRGGLDQPPVRAGDAAISGDTVWQVSASPPRQLRQLQPPNNGDFKKQP